MKAYNYARTSLNQVPAAMKAIRWQRGTYNLDLGGGRFKRGTRYLSRRGVHNEVYDPYCYDRGHNESVIRAHYYNTVTIFNVFNVIPSYTNRRILLGLALHCVLPGGKIYISVYEGNKSGEPTVSRSRTWQANRYLMDYHKELVRMFPRTSISLNHGEHIWYFEISVPHK